MKIETYNFLFHPFHESHATSVKICSLVTSVALSAITLGVYFLLFVSVHAKEICCPERIKEKTTILGEEKSLPGKGKRGGATPFGAGDTAHTGTTIISDSVSTRPVIGIGVDLPPEAKPKVVDVKAAPTVKSTLTTKSSVVKNKQADHLKKLKTLAQNGEWRNLATHTSHAHSGFDWWMFPVDRSSRGQGSTYTVDPADIRSLKQDKEFMESFRDGVNLVARSWGWNLVTGVDETCAQRKWSGYQVRLGKMLSSLRLFGEWDLREKLVAFVFQHSSVTTFDAWIRRELSTSRLS